MTRENREWLHWVQEYKRHKLNAMCELWRLIETKCKEVFLRQLEKITLNWVLYDVNQLIFLSLQLCLFLNVFVRYISYVILKEVQVKQCEISNLLLNILAKQNNLRDRFKKCTKYY